MRPRAHASVFVSSLIVPHEDAVVTAAVSNFGISRLRHGVSAFAIGHAVPCGQWNRPTGMSARPFKRAFVLLRAVDVIRKLVVKINVVELTSRLIVLGAPRLARIGRHGRAAVVALEQNPGVLRIDPYYVIIAMRRFQFREGLGAVM